MLVYIGIGSNLHNPLQQVLSASERLARLPHCKLLQLSSCYQSEPLGPADQPDFINQVAAVETKLEPEPLLDLLQEIEQEMGRVRTLRWGPRIIDLDILLYADRLIQSSRLIIPHAGLKERTFVLYPLAEIAPELRLPTGEKIIDLLPKPAKIKLVDLTSPPMGEVGA